MRIAKDLADISVWVFRLKSYSARASKDAANSKKKISF